MVQPFVGPDGHAGGDAPLGAADGGYYHCVQRVDCLIACDNQDGPGLVAGRLEQPQLALGYHGSASVKAMALAIAWAWSASVWGCRR